MNPFENQFDSMHFAETDTKMSVIYLPGQSGKTSKVQNQIEIIDLFSEINSPVVNIWLSSNNMTLESQTYSRLSRDECTNRPIIWDSKNKNSTETIAFKIQNKKTNLVVCCTNKRRIDQLDALVRLLDESADHIPVTVNVWIDEADSTLNVWQSFVESTCKYAKIVDKITLITASGAEKFCKTFGRIYVHGYDCAHPEVYHACWESRHMAIEQLESPENYVKKILSANHFLLEVGKKTYVPGGRTQHSHEQITATLLEKDAAVFLINGVHKELRLPCGAVYEMPTKFDSPEEMKTAGDIILEFYKKYNLSQYMTAIVGLNCTGRGITFQSPEFMLDYAILANISNQAEAYQTACRTSGNIKGFSGYSPPMIISPSKMWRNILKQERIALNLCKIVNDRSVESTGPIYKSDIGLAKNYGDREHREFDTQKQVREFVFETFGKKIRANRSSIAPQTLWAPHRRNPTKEEILDRWWGLSEKKKAVYRVIPTNENKWVVYWQPSFI